MRRRDILKWTLAGLAAETAGPGVLAIAADPRLSGQGGNGLPFDRMAAHIVRALKPARGERAMLRFDTELMPGLLRETRRQMAAAGAVVEVLSYGAAENFEQRLAETDIYVWLPASPGPTGVTPGDQAAALVRWLDAGRGRQIHFHWADGTRGEDSSNGQHSEVFDQIYLDALEIDYAALDQQMEETIARLRSAEVNVETPQGTDLRFRLGDRPVCKQNGDASRERMKSARMRIDREIELPAGALRMAPLEESVKGRIVIPRATLGGAAVRDIELNFKKGVVSGYGAANGQEFLRRTLDSNRALKHFREFALGLNSKLIKPADSRWVPYYGYGAGMVRLSLGDNEELGGAVRGGAVRWFFFPGATVRAGSQIICENGVLK